jgi:ribosomal protein S18 acetylase RimI-like enzyme
MRTMLAALREGGGGGGGVHLVAASSNRRARSMYEQFGFRDLVELKDDCVVMGLKFADVAAK